MRLEDLPLEPGERMLWAQPAWQGLRSACLNLPVLPLYALIVALRLAEVVHRRAAAGADPFMLGWREALEAMFFLGVGGAVSAIVLDLRARTYFVTDRRVGMTYAFPGLRGEALWSHAATAEEQQLRGGRIKLTWPAGSALTDPPLPCGRANRARAVTVVCPAHELPALRQALAERLATIAPDRPPPSA